MFITVMYYEFITLRMFLTDTLTSCQRKVQEAMFEVITSEASYLKSLEVLVSHFLSCPAFSSESVISKREKNILFSDILPGNSLS